MRLFWLCAALPLALTTAACGDEGGEDGGTGGATGSGAGGATGGAGPSGGGGGSGGAPVNGGSGGSSATSAGTGGSPVAGELFGPCTTDADCPGFLNYKGKCYADWPGGGFCSRACTWHNECGSNDIGRCAEFEGGFRCLVRCLNFTDMSQPLPCPAGYTCADFESCTPGGS